MNSQELMDWVNTHAEEWEDQNECQACKSFYPSCFGGVFCPRCEDMVLEAQEMNKTRLEEMNRLRG